MPTGTNHDLLSDGSTGGLHLAMERPNRQDVRGLAGQFVSW